MTILIAFVGLLATIYAVLPRERRLELRLRLTAFDAVIAVVTFLLILDCEFYSFVLSHPFWGVALAWPANKCPKDMTTSAANDLILLLGGAVVAARMRLRRLSRRNIRKFRKLLDELYWAGGYEEIFNFLERHGDMLFRLGTSDFALARLRRWFRPSLSFRKLEIILMHDELQKESTAALNQGRITRAPWLNSIVRSATRWIQTNFVWSRIFLPNYSNSEVDAKAVIDGLFLSDPFILQMVRLRPYLGVSLITIWKPRCDRTDFIHAYLWKLMEEPSSILYTELRANQCMRSMHRYDLPENNRLLNFFLADAHVTEESNAYKPIGDYVLMLLDELRQDPTADPYNRAMGYFIEHEQWKSPLYAVIRFFDIMVEEALHQNIEWHMWLYYMPPVVEKMARNYRLNDPLSDANYEFPNRYAYLIYEIFSCLRNWVKDAAMLPRSQANVVLERVDSQHENGNIPKSSIKALCESLYYVLTSENLDNGLKHSLAGSVFSLFFEIRNIEGFQDYGSVLLLCIQDAKSYKPQRVEYIRALQTVFAKEHHEYRIVHHDTTVNELKNFLDTLR